MRWAPAHPRARRHLARRLPGALLFAGALLAVFLMTNWLFEGNAAAFAFFGTIFAFWVVCCVILPRRNAHASKPQS